MISYYFYNPGIFLILLGLLLNAVPKRLCNVLILTLVPLLYIGGMLFLGSYSHQQFLFTNSQITNILVFLFFLVLTISMITGFLLKGTFLEYTGLLLIYTGSTIAILFTKNLVFILLFLEIMMFSAVLIIFLQRNDQSKREGIRYFKFHMLGGTLFLAGIMSYYFQHNTFDIRLLSQNDFYGFGSILILSGLLVNLAVPPFSSWLIGSYTIVPSYINLIFAICTTKISALILLKIFAGWHILIFIGFLTAFYGIIFSIFDSDIKKIILYIIIAEIGIILIFIGSDQNNFPALLSIINDLFCIPILLGIVNFVIDFLKIDKITKTHNIFNNTKSILILYSIALLSVTAFPFSLGYIGKKYLYLSDYFKGNLWIKYVMDAASIGIILSVGFRFTYFVFFRDFLFKRAARIKKCEDFKKYYYIAALYSLLITLAFITIYILKQNIPQIGVSFVPQITYIIIAGVTFIIFRKHLIYKGNLQSLDPNMAYLSLNKIISKNIMILFRYVSVYLDNQLDNSINVYRVIRSYFKNRYVMTRRIDWIIILAVIMVFIALYPLKWI